MKIYFDHSANPDKGGIGRDSRYVENLLKVRLLGLKEEEAFQPSNVNILKKKIAFYGCFTRGLTAPVSKSEVFFEFQFSGYRVKDPNTWHFVRVHDVFPITNPEWFKWTSVRIFSKSLQRSLRHNRTLYICNSKTTRENLVRLFPDVASKATVLYCEAFANVSPKSELCPCSGCLFIENNNSAFILMVGTIEPRKNYPEIINILENYDMEILCVVVGRPGWKTKKTQQRLHDNSKLIWISECCDNALDSFYNRCVAFLSTSFDEGFNLPAAEANLRKKPLILRKLAIYDELYKSNYISYSNPDELVAHLQNINQNCLQIENCESDTDIAVEETLSLIRKIMEEVNS